MAERKARDSLGTVGLELVFHKHTRKLARGGLR
jgi:hypothetical protein